MRILLRALAVVIVLAAAAAGLLYLALQPPAPLPLPERGATLDDVTVIEPGLARREGQRVVVAGSAIESVGPRAAAGGPFAGMYVLPGLTDLHVHFPPAALPGQTELFAFLLLYHGVTAVRDAGDVDGTASEPARRGIAEGRFPGPRVVACGPFVDGEPPIWKNTLLARDAEEGRRAVETLAERGYDCVKAYNELGADTLAAVREAAHARGLEVIGHVPRRVAYEAARLDDAQHLIGIAPHPDASLRFPFVLAAFERLDDARIDALAAESVRLGIANTPTLVTIDRLIHSEDPARVLGEPDAELLPRFYREVVWLGHGGTSVAGQTKPEDFAMVRRAFLRMKQVVRRMHERGARLHTGTDVLAPFVVPGAGLYRELRLWVDAGFTPEEALAASMRTSAEFLGVSGLGAVRAGAPAELLVFRDDPTRSLDALGSLVAVVRDGRLYPRAALDAQLARYREHFDGALYDAVVTPLVRRALASTRGGLSHGSGFRHTSE
jgi:imidazolonepropionase-like amidohydrolase